MQVELAQQEEIVDVALFEPRCVALIFAELMLAKMIQGFAISPRLLKDLLLLVAKILPAQKVPFRCLSLFAERGLTKERKLQFCRSRTGTQPLRFFEL